MQGHEYKCCLLPWNLRCSQLDHFHNSERLAPIQFANRCSSEEFYCSTSSNHSSTKQERSAELDTRGGILLTWFCPAAFTRTSHEAGIEKASGTGKKCFVMYGKITVAPLIRWLKRRCTSISSHLAAIPEWQPKDEASTASALRGAFWSSGCNCDHRWLREKAIKKPTNLLGQLSGHEWHHCNCLNLLGGRLLSLCKRMLLDLQPLSKSAATANNKQTPRGRNTPLNTSFNLTVY